jgi:hypothetical protein
MISSSRIPRMMLNDAAITNALNQTVEKIREGDLEQAQRRYQHCNDHKDDES